MSEQQKDSQAATPPVVRLAAAEVDAVAARDRLNDTVARLQSKLDPKLLARQATEEAKAVGGRGADYARDNPKVVGGTAAAVLLFLVRKPLFRLFRRRKGPKPQKAAKPMTVNAPNERLARSPHPAQPPAAPAYAAAPLAPVPNPTPLAPPEAGARSARLEGSTI